MYDLVLAVHSWISAFVGKGTDSSKLDCLFGIKSSSLTFLAIWSVNIAGSTRSELKAVETRPSECFGGGSLLLNIFG